MGLDFQGALGNAGAPPRFEWRGKTYTLQFRTYRMLAEFERWAKELFERELLHIKPFCTQPQWEEKVNDLEKKRNEGHFSFYGDHCSELRQSPGGALQMLRITLGESATDKDGKPLTDDDLRYMHAERGVEIDLAFGWFNQQLDEAHRLSGATRKDDKWEGGDPKALQRLLAERGLL